MNNYKYLILSILYFIILVSIISCNRIKNNPVSGNEQHKIGEGLCIYATKVEYTSNLSYQNFNVESAPIIDNPIISYHDIISYDTSSHILNLTYPHDSLNNRIGQIDLYGKPFLITLDSIKIYGGWFWTDVSSIPCHWVVIEPSCIFDTLKINEIRIKLGYPNENNFKGEDPRNNIKILNRLIKDGKVK